MSFLDLIYELPRGALVEIHLKNEVIRGEFYLALKGVGRHPEVDKIRLDRSMEKEHYGSVCISVKDIINFIVLEVGVLKRGYEIPQSGAASIGLKNGVVSKEAKEPVELILRTYEIRDAQELKFLMKFLKDLDVCGVSFEGQNIGRNGKVAWIVLAAGKTVVPIDVVSLSEQIENFWQVLDKDLFGNAKLVKIIHDARPAADFLFHNHGIKFINIFDTQVADVVVFQTATKSVPTELSTLSECLSAHNYRIPEEELKFLRELEKFDFSTDSPMLIRPHPPPIFLKYCALRVKHLVPLRENLMTKMMMKMTYCTLVHVGTYVKRSNRSYACLFKDTRTTSPELQTALEDDTSHHTFI